MHLINTKQTPLIVIGLLTLHHHISCEKVNLAFSQDDYDVKINILECSWYNKSVLKNPIFGLAFYNRTHRVLNCSYDQLIDLKNDAMVSVQMYKFVSNEYRFFPMTFAANVCAEYNRNSFSLKTMFEQKSNTNYCDSKEGFYYFYNLMPDFTKFPPHLPRGSYKLVSSLSYHTYKYLVLNLYLAVLDKPTKWKQTSKSIPNIE